jgi:hypothetical protein
VAVVQISRIQVRRGRKGVSDIPQLASGELGWAVDTQELYIGNGSVAEGAPFVGNTKILTSTDNIFEIADQYEYKTGSSLVRTVPTTRTPIRVTLQERLDYDVYVANFGAVHDDSVIQTEALQRAIDNVFLITKTSPQNRYILQIAPGLYKINASLKLPPYCTLRGAGKNKTIIEQTTANPIFVTVNGSGTVGGPYDEEDEDLDDSNQSTNLDISGMTLQYSSGSPKLFDTAIVLQSTSFSNFYNLKIKGYWSANDGAQADSKAVDLQSFSSSYRSKNNLFKNIEIEGFCYAVDSSFDIENNTFRDVNFCTCLIAARLGANMPAIATEQDLEDQLEQGRAIGPQNTLFENCSFREILNQAIVVNKGSGNTSKNNKFYDVGCDTAESMLPVTSAIKFDVEGNVSIDDWFERTKTLSYDTEYVNVNAGNSINYQADISGGKYIPEVEGIFNYKYSDLHKIDTISTTGNWVTAFRLPANQNRSFEIDYFYRSPQVTGVRTGTLTIMIDISNQSIKISDEFEFTGSNMSVAENLTFRARLVNITSGNISDTTVETAYIEMRNATASDSGKLYFTIASKS